jgi:hypothetical protein
MGGLSQNGTTKAIHMINMAKPSKNAAQVRARLDMVSLVSNRPNKPEARRKPNIPDATEICPTQVGEVRPFRCDPVTTERAEVCVMRWPRG